MHLQLILFVNLISEMYIMWWEECNSKFEMQGMWFANHNQELWLGTDQKNETHKSDPAKKDDGKEGTY